MHTPRRWFYSGLLPVAAGLSWLTLGWSSALLTAVIATLPGVVLIAAGAALLLWPGDRHITHFLALAGLAGAVLALLLSPWFGVMGGLWLLIGSGVSFLVAGRAAVLQTVLPADAPAPGAGWTTWRKAASDEALLGFFVACAHIPMGDDVTRDAEDIRALQTFTDARGPELAAADWHRAPGPPAFVQFEPAHASGCDFDRLTFDSEFVPDEHLPGAQRWRAYGPNARMSARVFRHSGAPRPWLICIHGYRMGNDSMDLSLFAVKRLHHDFGLNLLMPMLPLHGPRRVTRISGGLFLDGPMIDLIHTESQALWDLRRCLAWIHATQPDAAVGALGYSLGGYNAALLAAFEASLSCVIAAIPVTDMPAAVWRQMPLLHRRYIEAGGIDIEQLSALMAPVSPLHWPCAVPRERRYIVAACADQLVSADQPLRLWRHWDRPAMHWYDGSHLSVRRDRGRLAFMENALRESGLIAHG